MIFYTGIVMTPYDSRLGLITRGKKELEICHNCNTYQHMLTKKNEKSKRTTMCPKCRMVTIKLFSYPDLLLSTYEEDIVSTSLTMTGEVKSKRNSCRSRTKYIRGLNNNFYIWNRLRNTSCYHTS